MIIKHLELKNQIYKNITLNGLSVKAYLNGQAGSFGSTQIDFSQCVVKCILNRNGKPHVIAQDNLKVLGVASTVDTMNQQAFSSKVSRDVVIAGGVTGLVSFIIPFGGHINLRGDDEIIIEVQNMANLFAQQGMQAASYLEIKPLKSVGVEKFVPKIQTLVIQKNEQSNQYMIGDNLIRLVMVNFDQNDYQNNVVNNLIFSSDRLDDTWTFADLVLQKTTRYNKQLVNPAITDEAASFEQDQSFVLTDFHQEFMGVGLELQFNAPNVNQSQNYIVTWTYSTDWTILQKAADTEAKHANDAAARITANSK